MRERDVVVYVTSHAATIDRPASVRVRLVHKPTNCEASAEAPHIAEARNEAHDRLVSEVLVHEAAAVARQAPALRLV